ALRYAEQLNDRPGDTVCILISDLYENGSIDGLLASAQRLISSGLRLIPLLALSDSGAPAYDKEVAEELALMGTRPFACTPDKFAEVLGEGLYS
ncbi:MAG: VWA domain-containing protein, partial [Bacteroidota bacterium]